MTARTAPVDPVAVPRIVRRSVDSPTRRGQRLICPPELSVWHTGSFGPGRPHTGRRNAPKRDRPRRREAASDVSGLFLRAVDVNSDVPPSWVYGAIERIASATSFGLSR